jgi:hypothetical protein
LEKLNAAPESNPTEALVEMNRLNNLSDGVFAIALTLLAFDIRLPEGVAIGDLPNKLIDSKAAEGILLDGVFGGGLESHVDRSEEAANIQLRDPERPGFLNWKYPWSWGSAILLDWTLHLSDQIPLALEIETATEEAAFELGAEWLARHERPHIKQIERIVNTMRK